MRYSVLIVDDEKKIREGLMRHVEWNALHFQAPLQASEGLEALELMKTHSVDVLITDIRMPMMDGLQLIEQITRMRPEISIILLSGFRDFDYAKQAMAFGVKHYLTKPTDLGQLNKALMEVASERDSRLLQQTQMKTFEEKYMDAVDLLFEQFLEELIFGNGCSPEAVQEFLFEHRIELPYSRYCVMTLASMPHSLPANDKLTAFRGIRNLRGSLQRFSIAVFPFTLKQEEDIHLLLNYNEGGQRDEAVRHLLQTLSPADPHPPVFLSDAFLSLSDLQQGSRQALERKRAGTAAQAETEAQAAFPPQAQTPAFERFSAPTHPRSLDQEIIRCMLAGKADETEQAVAALFAYLKAHHASIEILRQGMRNAMLAVQASVENFQSKPLGSCDDLSRSFLQLDDAHDPSEMERQLKAAVLACALRLNQSKSSMSHKFVAQIKSYIEKNYMDDITLQSASNAVHLSPTYVSKLFKKVTGSSFVEYVTQVRVREAQSLLRNIHMKIYEIGDRVGYRSTKHFSQVFKAVSGLTPSEYRDRIRIGEDG
ncbi:response regulator [Paenibacillus sp. HB172176]|uniref:response regulator transcription factor n=1 Tax=Paenibacillus sp. HB172176 TaxID=2493690 RepID=UPI00143B7760|nr:response regulator [Paenibacillus sp. HB172176]